MQSKSMMTQYPIFKTYLTQGALASLAFFTNLTTEQNGVQGAFIIHNISHVSEEAWSILST